MEAVNPNLIVEVNDVNSQSQYSFYAFSAYPLDDERDPNPS